MKTQEIIELAAFLKANPDYTLVASKVDDDTEEELLLEVNCAKRNDWVTETEADALYRMGYYNIFGEHDNKEVGKWASCCCGEATWRRKECETEEERQAWIAEHRALVAAVVKRGEAKKTSIPKF